MADHFEHMDPVQRFHHERALRAERRSAERARTEAAIEEARAELEAEVKAAGKGGRPRKTLGIAAVPAKKREVVIVPKAKRGRPRNSPSHGMRARYRQGCRCDACKDAEAAYQRDYYRQLPRAREAAKARVRRHRERARTGEGAAKRTDTALPPALIQPRSSRTPVRRAS